MTSPRFGLFVFLSLATRALLAADTCSCPDIADLRNRESEQRAAIQAYQAAIARWAGSPPDASENSRTALQSSDIQSAINAATSSGTNKATGKTDAACSTTIDESTTCMKEVAAQHEFVHAGACRAARASSAFSFGRWSTLADYAREEIAAYQAEAAYTHAALVDLQSKCRLEIEMVSEIRGGPEVAVSNAKAKVVATFDAPDHQSSTGYKGSGSLEYKTKDAGPPKKVGDKMLMKLMPVCYVTSVGTGTTPFNVLNGYFWRGNTPPYEPRLDLEFEIHTTNEDHILKGERGCPKEKTKQPFWSDKFLMDKQATTAANHILIDGWTMEPRSDVYAEKVIQGTCGEAGKFSGRLASYGPLVACVEKTTFTVRLKR